MAYLALFHKLYGRFQRDRFYKSLSYNGFTKRKHLKVNVRRANIMRKGLTEVVFILDRSGSM